MNRQDLEELINAIDNYYNDDRKKESYLNKIKMICSEYCNDCNANYEFELGSDVIRELSIGNEFYFYSVYKIEGVTKIKEIIGFPVRINFEKPELIKLWKEVKFE